VRAQQIVFDQATGWQSDHDGYGDTDLVIYFGSREALACGTRYHELRSRFARGHIIGCSTGGQILGEEISDDRVGAVGLSFAATRLRLASEKVDGPSDSRRRGEAIGQALFSDDLSGVFILSDGLNVNGSELVRGIISVIGAKIPLTGGLAGDGARFQETLVGSDCAPIPCMIAAVGFYGDAIKLGHGSAGGWDVFGPRRTVTSSIGNVLYKLDNENALDLYERYLGEEDSKGLPGTALLFPLQIHDREQPHHGIVRTVLSIDRQARSMTFAGDVPEGCIAQLMRGNFDRLAAGAADAARQANEGSVGRTADDGVAILVSCIGRRLLMGQRVTDEIEAAAAALGPRFKNLGFYSYGEISPHATSGSCELHNQTMTVTAISECAG
jgi:hypothetical protein